MIHLIIKYHAEAASPPLTAAGSCMVVTSNYADLKTQSFA